MNRLGVFRKIKKGFTLIELIVVLAIMAIGTAMVLPNLRGTISRTEISKIKNYCIEAKGFVKNYTNLLLGGEEYVSYELPNGTVARYYIKDSESGLRLALNKYNQNTAYQYYVVGFATEDDKSSGWTDPSSKIRSEMEKSNSIFEPKDVMVACIEVSTAKNNQKTQIYTCLGFWYYSYEKKKVVYTFVCSKTNGSEDYSDLI